MGRTAAVSFEEDSIKIVHASFKGHHLSIEKAEVIESYQFDSYLGTEKADEFIVTYDFNESYHDVISIPVVKTAHLKKIIEAEIRKATGLKDLSFIYAPIGEEVVENRKILKVFYFAVRNEEIREVVQRFYDNGKIVKALYPRVFSAAPLFGYGTPGEAVIGVLGTQTEKTAFLIKGGIIYFIRKFKSLTADISALDIQDINMTINYCYQNIRINPSLVMLVGNLSEFSSVDVVTSVPLACLCKPDNIYSTRQTFNDFLVPISSFLSSKSSNILSREFKNISALKNYLLNASRVFVVLTVVCLIVILYNVKNIFDMKDKQGSMQKANADIETILSEYAAVETELNKYMPVVNFINKSTTDIQRLLISLSGIEMKNSRIDTIEAAVSGEVFSVTINGKIEADTYTSIYARFQDIIYSLGTIKDVKVAEKTLDVSKKSFSVKLQGNFY